MENLSYQYSIGNLFECPQKYQISPYIGKSFLKSYEDSRKKILKLLNIQIDTLKIQKLLDENFVDIKNSNSIIKEKFETHILLNSILRKILKKNTEKIDDEVINIFVKKFEIKKKLFFEYDSKFKEITDDYQNLKNYLLLSIICLLKFEKFRNLKFLNVSLKINDLLCSQLGIKRDEIENVLLAFALSKELNLIENLCIEKGLR